MAWMVVRSSAVSIALALAGCVVCAQSRPPVAQNPEPLRPQNARIVSLLEQLAEQARTSKNLGFAVRAQSQAARLLWAQDPDRARAIYKQAFQSLAASLSPKDRESAEAAEAAKASAGRQPAPVEKRQLRTELLNQITARDPQLAEELARGLADSIGNSKNDCVDSPSADCSSTGGSLSRAQPEMMTTKTREDAERSELMMSAALQVVDRDPQQAMAFAQMSVALGVSSNLARFLSLMRAVDAERADLLFSNAMARIERASQVDLADVHTLGSYVVSTVNSGTAQPLSKPLVVRFLNFAFDQIAGREPVPPRGARRDDSAFYFVGRQLTDLFGRYLPYRLDQLTRYVTDQTDAGSYNETIDPRAMKVSAPSDIARDAIQAADPVERDSLYARAALAWLAEGDVKEAQAAALKVSDAQTRDRVLAQIVRKHTYEKRIEDAVALARRISDDTSRAELLAMLGGAARISKDNARAVELLNEAVVSSLKARPTLDRAQSLVMIASSFSEFDTVRSFEVLQSAVQAINDLGRQHEVSKDEPTPAGSRATSVQTVTLEQLNTASLESTLAALAKADFEGALALARELPGEEASVIAQLAVCGGGLVGRSSGIQSTGGDEIESALNH